MSKAVCNTVTHRVMTFPSVMDCVHKGGPDTVVTMYGVRWVPGLSDDCFLSSLHGAPKANITLYVNCY